MSETIAVLGAGNMGTAVAQVLASNGHTVRAWSIETDVLEEMRDRRANTKYLAGGKVHPGIQAVWGIEKGAASAAVVVTTGPSQEGAGITREMEGDLPPQRRVVSVGQ